MDYVIILGILMVIILLGMPVAFALIIVSAGVLMVYLDPLVANLQVPQLLFNALNNSILIAIPLFILTGQILLKSGIGTKAFDAANKWFGHLPGGLAIASVLTCAFFASLTGSSIATVLTIGYIASSEMIKNGYPKRLAYGIIAAAGTLGILIPPSGPMILYGAMTNVSITDLFMAGIIPGILLVIIFIVYVVLVYGKKLKRGEKASKKERVSALKDISWLFLLPVIIIFGIYSGIFTVTESAAVACIVSLLLALFVYKGITVKGLFESLKETASNVGMIALILAAALLFGFAITAIELPQTIQLGLESLNMNKWTLLLLIFVIFVILGMFMDVISILLIMVPILHPILVNYGVDLLWFGIFTIIALEMSAITPPIGLNLFVMMQISEKQGTPLNLIKMSYAAAPYLCLMILLIAIITLVPQFVSYLPDTIK
ncbi:TRAP transporter large permease [Neobacillus niacini]|uniref:TRAP transporter large permease n=1 Tax=Neobacillus niacini TaxID=86668 RepID=UPI0007ABF56C|nr:TRAP transporter large permease [Neobacillus niacini]MEC1523220.1 TRAP transporter large permease [Neobacillus niacini]